MFKRISPLLLMLFVTGELFAETLTIAPQANDDYASLVVGLHSSVTFNVDGNDRYGSAAIQTNPDRGQYGDLLIDNNIATYTLFDSPATSALGPDQTVTDVFTYTYLNSAGQSDTASIFIRISGNPQVPIAMDDYVTVMPNNIITATGSVTDNDRNGSGVFLSSSPVSAYGYLILNYDGSYTYTLYDNSTAIIALTAGEIVTDSFTYTYINGYGRSTTAQLNVQIIGNPVDANGNTIFIPPTDTPLDNVDIEYNDRSANATPLNSGLNIKGHLYGGEDKDWYRIHSAGNEIIKLELCPQGTGCYQKKSWEVYVFDSATLTTAMEEQSYTFLHWVDATGSINDMQGNPIIGATWGSSNHMYLAYQLGYFDGALIGIIDPCFDTTNSVEIGVGAGEKDYFIAVSSTLMGGDASAQPAGQCGVGSVILHKATPSAVGSNGTGQPTTFTTTAEYINVYPFSDDQYTIKVTGTGVNPLLTSTAAARAARFNANTGELTIPKVRVSDNLYSANLTLQNEAVRTNNLARSARGESGGGLKFLLTGLEGLGLEEIADAFQSTYDPSSQQLFIPRVTDLVSGNPYSVVLQYHAEPDANGNSPWLEAVEVSLIQ